MSSTLCAASRTVSAQEKRKCNGAKPKSPTKIDFILDLCYWKNQKFTRAYPHMQNQDTVLILYSSQLVVSKDKAVENMEPKKLMSGDFTK